MTPLTILVAEDELLSRMVLERSVVQWGHRLISATNGETARELLQTRSIDVCILDWEMPKVSGPEICQWLRSSNLTKTPYVILITAKEKPEEIQCGYEAGADDYLVKPCDLKYLRRRITMVAEKIQRKAEWLEPATKEPISILSGLTPLDIYLSDLRLMRRKT
ncbi:MAG TPA: response regulator [Candidatus Angelobacter sp.]|nr:response regulator [Candidatus Angelobacter sp.]